MKILSTLILTAMLFAACSDPVAAPSLTPSDDLTGLPRPPIFTGDQHEYAFIVVNTAHPDAVFELYLNRTYHDTRDKPINKWHKGVYTPGVTTTFKIVCSAPGYRDSVVRVITGKAHGKYRFDFN